MGDNSKPHRIMQVAVFHPGNSSSNSPQSQPPILLPQTTLPQQQPIRPMPQHPQQPAIQTQTYFQPIVPTPVRLMVNKSNGPAPPPTIENLRLVGTAQCQYRPLLPTPNNEGGQRIGPQFTKIAPRTGPLRYPTIQPGQAIITMNRPIHMRPYTVNGPSSSSTVFQAVPFTTPQNNIMCRNAIEQQPKQYTFQFSNEPCDSPPVLQQEEPCRQNSPSASDEVSSTSAAAEQKPQVMQVVKAKRTSEPKAEPTVAPKLPEPPIVPVKRRRAPIEEDDNVILYPPQKAEDQKKDFEAPDEYEFDEFLTETVLKPKDGILHHHVNGTDIAEYPEDIDEEQFASQKYRKISKMVGLETPIPKKEKKSPVRRQSKRLSESKKESQTETEKDTSLNINEKLFSKFFDQFSEKAKEAIKTSPNHETPIKKSTRSAASSSSIIISDDEVADEPSSSPPQNAPAVPVEEPQPQLDTDIVANTAVEAVNETEERVNEEENNGPATAPPPPAANSPPQPPQRSPPPTPRAAPSESELKEIAEKCAMDIAGCSASQVPGGLPLKRLSRWTVEECQNWTQQVTNCDDYRGIFEREEIDGSVLVFVPYNELAQLLSLRFGPAKKMEVALKVVKAYDTLARNL